MSLIDEHLAPNFFYKSPFVEYTGYDDYRQMVTGFRAIFPDLHIAIDDIIGEGDKLAVRLTTTGTMKGELMGIAPTGKKVEIKEAVFVHFAYGKVAETLAFGDTLAFYQQLGISPPGQ